MLRNNGGKAPQPKVVKPTTIQKTSAATINKPSNLDAQLYISLGLTCNYWLIIELQYKSYLETKKMLGSRVDDTTIINKVKSDLSVR